MRVFRDGWIAFVVVLAAAVAAAALVTLRQPTLYGAKGILIVSPVRGFLDPSGAGNLATIADTIRRLPSTTALTTGTRERYARSAPSPAVAAERRAKSADWVSAHVAADRIPGSSMIEVKGTAGTETDAVDLTRAAVESLSAYVNDSPSSSLPDQFPAGVAVLTPTVGEAQGKVSPAPLRNNLIGINAGVLLGVLAALALGLARRKLRRPAEVAEELGIPVLGVVSGSRRPRPLADRGRREPDTTPSTGIPSSSATSAGRQIGRASCRERV